MADFFLQMDAFQAIQNEDERLRQVESYQILGTAPESDYDNINMLVAMICDVPISLIQVLGKEKFYLKSKLGVDIDEINLDASFCRYTIKNDKLLEVEDAREDIRFKDNSIVTQQKALFYAGIPFLNKEGYTLGTICVYDYRPRKLEEEQKEALRILANQVVNLFELRKSISIHQKIENELIDRNDHLKDFASHVSHDLKSPLANISSLTELLREDDFNSLSQESKQYLDYISESTEILKEYIDGILVHYKSDELLNNKTEDIFLDVIASKIELLLVGKNQKLIYEKNVPIKNINKAAVSQILINLVDNALKYNDKEIAIINIDYVSDLFYHKFSVTDNGIGIPEDKQKFIFKIFKTLKNPIGKSGTGIGLSTVKNLVEKMGGSIFLKSSKGKGSTFSFTIAK